MSKQIALAAALSAVGSAALATGITIKVMSAKLQRQYAEQLEAEIAATKLLYSRRYKDGEFADLAKMAEKIPDPEPKPKPAPQDETKRQAEYLKEAVKILEEQQYVPYHKVDTAEPQPEEERVEVLASMKKNIWDQKVPVGIVETEDFDEAKEFEKRDEGQPYIIREAYYYENPDEKKQFTFQYFEGDDVLVDEKDRPVDKVVIERNLGLNNLRFGYGSDNKNTVLIHNPVSDNMYEVVRTLESYYGEFDEVENRGSTLRKFRADD